MQKKPIPGLLRMKLFNSMKEITQLLKLVPGMGLRNQRFSHGSGDMIKSTFFMFPVQAKESTIMIRRFTS